MVSATKGKTGNTSSLPVNPHLMTVTMMAEEIGLSRQYMNMVLPQFKTAERIGSLAVVQRWEFSEWKMKRDV